MTSKTPSSMVRMETSNVPPPKSNTRMFCSSFWSRPQAMAAAVGSLRTRTTFKPAMIPASLVDCLWELSKQAGTVTIAFLIFLPEYDSAISLILTSTMAEISSGAKTLVSPLTLGTSMQGFPSLSTISQGRYFLSYWTVLSEYFLPMSLLTSQRVRVGLTVAWFLAASPISLSSSVKATTEGVILLPSSLGMTSTCPFLKMPTHEKVVPRSIPMMGHSYFSSYLAEARARIATMKINFIIILFYYYGGEALTRDLQPFSRVNLSLIQSQIFQNIQEIDIRWESIITSGRMVGEEARGIIAWRAQKELRETL